MSRSQAHRRTHSDTPPSPSEAAGQPLGERELGACTLVDAAAAYCPNEPATIGELAEARIARYLREQGYAFEVEPEFDTGRHPDCLITAGEHAIVAEVKAFETYGMFANVPGQA
ncbi:hypothetical protein [Streptomyces odonnellii]|uniref:hypothetical protein n=1 Tax=Streptomyces odonnellii TaxID=1417980 RepID=UPI000B0200D5|nr:hypothetical protein [Streptomyces odonnellii]